MQHRNVKFHAEVTSQEVIKQNDIQATNLLLNCGLSKSELKALGFTTSSVRVKYHATKCK